ncbi:unnamed protein product [Eretmochelys imbricata]
MLPLQQEKGQGQCWALEGTGAAGGWGGLKVSAPALAASAEWLPTHRGVSGAESGPRIPPPRQGESAKRFGILRWRAQSHVARVRGRGRPRPAAGMGRAGAGGSRLGQARNLTRVFIQTRCRDGAEPGRCAESPGGRDSPSMIVRPTCQESG